MNFKTDFVSLMQKRYINKECKDDKRRVTKTIGMDGRIGANKGAGNRFDRFLLSVEKGRTLGGLRNVEATNILRECQSASGRISTDGGIYESGLEQEKILIRYAIESGCWFSLDSIRRDSFGFLGQGTENKVYLDKDGKCVIKIADYNAINPYETPLTFLINRITLHNTIFPETSYELVGFNWYEGEKFYFVKKQLFIKGTKPTQEEIDKCMKDKGFSIIEDGVYLSDNFVIHDLFPRNFVKTEKGLRCIDPIIHLNTKDRGYGGNKSYREI